MSAWSTKPEMTSAHRLSPLLAIAIGLAATMTAQRPALASPGCESSPGIRIWTAPLEPVPGDPLEILAVATDGTLDQLQIMDPSSRGGRLHTQRGGGPPWSLRATLLRPERGSYRI